MSVAVETGNELADHTGLAPLLQVALASGRSEGLPYAGTVTPKEAWALLESGQIQIVDVRTAEERRYVGHVPGTLHLSWQTGSAMTTNPRFVKELERLVAKDSPVLLLCRSGKRSAAAAQAATRAGFRWVFNISEGFEGELNEQQQRGHIGGWRWHGLPWVQE